MKLTLSTLTINMFMVIMHIRNVHIHSYSFIPIVLSLACVLSGIADMKFIVTLECCNKKGGLQVGEILIHEDAVIFYLLLL